MEPTEDEDDDVEETDGVEEESAAALVDHPEIEAFLPRHLGLVLGLCAAHAAHGGETHEALQTGALCLVALEAWSGCIEGEVWVVVET